MHRNGTIIYPRLIEEIIHDHPAVKEASLVQVGEQAVMAVSLRRSFRRKAALWPGKFDTALLGDLPPGIDPCGENGEFHTFVYAGPILHAPVPHRRGAIVVREDRFVYCDLEEIPTS